MVLLFLLGLVRCVMFMAEQPQGSCMPHFFPYIVYLKKVLQKLGLTWSTQNLPRSQSTLHFTVGV